MRAEMKLEEKLPRAAGAGVDVVLRRRVTDSVRWGY